MECPPPQGVPCGMDFAPKWVRASARNAAFGGAGAEARVQTNAMLAPSSKEGFFRALGAGSVFPATGAPTGAFFCSDGSFPYLHRKGANRGLCGADSAERVEILGYRIDGTIGTVKLD